MSFKAGNKLTENEKERINNLFNQIGNVSLQEKRYKVIQVILQEDEPITKVSSFIADQYKITGNLHEFFNNCELVFSAEKPKENRYFKVISKKI